MISVTTLEEPRSITRLWPIRRGKAKIRLRTRGYTQVQVKTIVFSRTLDGNAPVGPVFTTR